MHFLIVGGVEGFGVADDVDGHVAGPAVVDFGGAGRVIAAAHQLRGPGGDRADGIGAPLAQGAGIVVAHRGDQHRDPLVEQHRIGDRQPPVHAGGAGAVVAVPDGEVAAPHRVADPAHRIGVVALDPDIDGLLQLVLRERTPVGGVLGDLAVDAGEQITPSGDRVDIQLKGAGQTRFSRRGDGRAALGPMLREYIISEAMHALGIPTTRSLAVVTTGEPVYRETVLQGAVLTRVAASHIRVGTMQWAAAHDDQEALRALADYTRVRHYPELADSPEPYIALFDAILARQASLIARWQLVGFIHGVMNTDNMALSGETIDYGPCAFMDSYDPATVFSSIDHGGRYAYGNQPPIAQWNLARLAEAMLPLFDRDVDRAVERATAALDRFPDLFEQHWLDGMRAKLGLFTQEDDDKALVDDLLAWMQRRSADFTNTFRSLTSGRLGRRTPRTPIPNSTAWHRRLDGAPRAAAAVARRGRGSDAAAQPGVHPAQSQRGGGAPGGDQRGRLFRDGAAARRAGDTLRPRTRPADVQRVRFGRAALPHVLRHVGAATSAARRARSGRRES